MKTLTHCGSWFLLLVVVCFVSIIILFVHSAENEINSSTYGWLTIFVLSMFEILCFLLCNILFNPNSTTSYMLFINFLARLSFGLFIIVGAIQFILQCHTECYPSRILYLVENAILSLNLVILIVACFSLFTNSNFSKFVISDTEIINQQTPNIPSININFDDYIYTPNTNKIFKIKTSVKYHTVLAIKNREIVPKCSTCLTDFKNDSDIHILECAHYFHTNCFEKWINSSDSLHTKKCPICRNTQLVEIEIVS